jgi:cytochrome P450
MDVPQPLSDNVAKPGRAPAAPAGLPIAGHIMKWRADPVKLLTDASRQGDIVELGLPGRTLLLTHPVHVKHVLQDNHQNYCKGWVFDRIRPYWGESLLTAEGETWRRQRRRVQPSFKRDHTTGFAPIITTRTAEMLSRWDAIAASGQPLALYNEMTELALVIIGDVLFGVDLWADAAEMAKSAQSALAVLKKRVAALAPLPLWMPTPDNRRFNGAMRMLNDRISAIVARKQHAGDTGPSFLAMLMAARDETGAPMTARQLHEEILGMLQQGHDTVGESLAWTWYLLAQHPEVERQLHREIADVLGDRVPEVADLPRLPYAHRILQESLRLYPPVWVIPRDAIHDDEIGGYQVPAGSTILLCPYLSHRRSEFWDNPEAFDPDRFLPERSKDRPRHAYYPFGGGPRLCMGVDMAMMEMLLIVVMVARKYRIHLVPGHREEPECVLDMIPRHHVRATLHKQQPVAATTIASPVRP